MLPFFIIAKQGLFVKTKIKKPLLNKGAKEMKRLNLKMAILRQKLTQRQFARKYKINERRLSGIVTGLLNQRPPEEEAIREVLGMKDPNDSLFEMMK
jgi:hypothetical protein